MNIGKAIRLIRSKVGLSQGQLAEQIQISQTALSQIENGGTPSPATIKKICFALAIPEPLLYILAIDEVDAQQGQNEVFNLLLPQLKEYSLYALSQELKARGK